MRTLLAVGCILLVGAGWAGPVRAQHQPADAALSGDDLRAIYVVGQGVIMEAETPSGMRVSTVLLANGAAYMQWMVPYGSAGQDVGSWRIDGDQLCLRFPKSWGETEHCRRHFRLGDNLYESRSPGGNVTGTYRLRR